jgi:hypothetical protein
MVVEWMSWPGFATALGGRILMAESAHAETLLSRVRAKILMALLALVLAGLGLVVLAWLGGRRLRRIAGQRPVSTRPHENRWYQKPLVPHEPESSGARDPE